MLALLGQASCDRDITWAYHARIAHMYPSMYLSRNARIWINASVYIYIYTSLSLSLCVCLLQCVCIYVRTKQSPYLDRPHQNFTGAHYGLQQGFPVGLCCEPCKGPMGLKCSHLFGPPLLAGVRNDFFNDRFIRIPNEGFH